MKIILLLFALTPGFLHAGFAVGFLEPFFANAGDCESTIDQAQLSCMEWMEKGQNRSCGNCNCARSEGFCIGIEQANYEATTGKTVLVYKEGAGSDCAVARYAARRALFVELLKQSNNHMRSPVQVTECVCGEESQRRAFATCSATYVEY